MKKACLRCGKDFSAYSNGKFCIDCRPLNKAEYFKKYAQTNRAIMRERSKLSMQRKRSGTNDQPPRLRVAAPEIREKVDEEGHTRVYGRSYKDFLKK